MHQIGQSRIVLKSLESEEFKTVLSCPIWWIFDQDITGQRFGVECAVSNCILPYNNVLQCSDETVLSFFTLLSQERENIDHWLTYCYLLICLKFFFFPATQKMFEWLCSTSNLSAFVFVNILFVYLKYMYTFSETKNAILFRLKFLGETAFPNI